MTTEQTPQDLIVDYAGVSSANIFEKIVSRIQNAAVDLSGYDDESETLVYHAKQLEKIAQSFTTLQANQLPPDFIWQHKNSTLIEILSECIVVVQNAAVDVIKEYNDSYYDAKSVTLAYHGEQLAKAAQGLTVLRHRQMCLVVL